MPYTGSLSSIPKGWYLCDGNNGTPNLTGRFLEGVTSGVKKFKDAGLPNITGRFNDFTTGDDNQSVSGAIYQSTIARKKVFADGDNAKGGRFFFGGFDASRSNGIYGKSSTVQPASYTVYYIMRVK